MSNRKLDSDPVLWEKLKPFARQMRLEPTPADNMLWQRLRKRQLANARFRRQHNIDRFAVDFYCAESNLVVEVDGPIHQYPADEDQIRQECLESLGLHVLRFTNDEVLTTVDSVLNRIRSALNPGADHPSP